MPDDQVKVNRKKRKKWPWITAGLLALLILVLTILPGRRTSSGSTVRQAVLEKGNLTVTVVGTGHLDYAKGAEVEILSGLVVDEIFVEAGDRVAQGDRLMTFDPLSVQEAIQSVLSQIESTDAAIQAASLSPDTRTVRSRNAGRVKAILISKEDKVSEVYRAEGALIWLSLDGRMALSLESPFELKEDEKVDVFLANGNRRDGTVQGIKEGKTVITLTDNGPEMGEEVTVKAKDGREIGTALLSIHHPLAIVATEGQVRSIHVTKNEKIAVGKALFTLEDLPQGWAYQQALADRQTLTERLDALLELEKSPVLLAAEDAYILQVNLQEGQLTGGDSLVQGVSGSTLATAQLTAAPPDVFVLSILVDELDILTVKEGQSARIVFDAIGQRTFEGVIEEVGGQGLESGGVAKYPVKIRIPAHELMRIGMSVTATIMVDEKVDILLLPVIALTESGGQAFVYTGRDDKSDSLTGQIQVETGLSDGDRVEIVEGLSEGTTVYYRVTASDSLFPFTAPGHRPGRNNTETPSATDGQP
ncbi:MAG: efflux RND transporter periplasmic adaptor subunit [Saccharofermentanales bacterium]